MENRLASRRLALYVEAAADGFFAGTDASDPMQLQNPRYMDDLVVCVEGEHAVQRMRRLSEALVIVRDICTSNAVTLIISPGKTEAVPWP